jgi:hypothetical protein
MSKAVRITSRGSNYKKPNKETFFIKLFALREAFLAISMYRVRIGKHREKLFLKNIFPHFEMSSDFSVRYVVCIRGRTTATAPDRHRLYYSCHPH